MKPAATLFCLSIISVIWRIDPPQCLMAKSVGQHGMGPKRMKKLVIASFLVLLSRLVWCIPFTISEIFLNSAGPGRDYGKEWIELSKLVQEKIFISRLRLEIYQKNEEPVFSEAVDLSPSVEFRNQLLIAQNKNLGLSECLKNDIAVVVLTKFNLPNNGDYRFCVTINDQQKACATLSKKIKPIDGVSLFRELTDEAESPWWKAEPCHLIDDVFATPGLNARACQQSPPLKDAIFEPCVDPHQPRGPPVVERLSVDNRSLNLASLQWSLHEDGIFTLSFTTTEDMAEPWLLSPCRASEKSERTCDVEGFSIVVATGTPNRIDLRSLAQPVNGRRFFRLRNLYGREGEIDEPEKMLYPQAVVGTRRPDIKVFPKSDSISIATNLLERDLPLNVQILARGGEIIGQRAFVSAGLKNIELNVDPRRPPVALRYFGAPGSDEILWPEPERSLPSGCQHGRPNELWWIAILWPLSRLVRARKNARLMP